MKTTFTTLLTGIAAALTFNLAASDWPEWRGPNKNGFVSSVGVPDSRWQVADAKVLWETQVGQGYSSTSVVGDRAYTMGHDKQNHETTYCLDTVTGEVIWKHRYPAKLMPAMHDGGPNATPTVWEGKVYTLSKDGQAFCLDAKSGAVQWGANIEELLEIKTPVWGFSGSPRIFEGSLILSAGRVIALDPRTGAKQWMSSATYHPGYATPVVFNGKERPLLAAFDGKGVSVFSARDGAELARHPFKTQYDMTAADPIVLDEGGKIFISALARGQMLRFDGDRLDELWSTRYMRNSLNTCHLADGYLYGIDGKHKDRRSKLVCLRVADGEVAWAEEEFGYGSFIVVGDTLIILKENGELVTAAVSSKGYFEISRKKVLDSICWTPPTIAGDHLYLRNDKGRLVCLKLK